MEAVFTRIRVQITRCEGAALLNLLNIHFAEAEALQHAGNCGARVVGSGLQDAVLQRCLLDLLLGDFADLAFEIRIRGREQSGVAGIYFRSRIVDSRAENLRGRQMNRDLPPLY